MKTRRQFLTQASMSGFAGAVLSAGATQSPVRGGSRTASERNNTQQAAAATNAQEKYEPKRCSSVKAPMENVAGKVAFVTGGSSGIGLGIARAFTDAGMKVVIGYRTKRHFEEAMTYLQGAKDRVHALSV